jgi:hypothetical protein
MCSYGPSRMRTLSPRCTSFERFTRSPFTCTFPASIVSAASDRVLKKRLAHSHLSNRTLSSELMCGNLSFVCVFVSAAALACGGDAAPPPVSRADSATVVAMRAESVTASHTAALKPMGLWDVDHVSERLVRSGMAPRRVEPAPPAPAFLASAKVAAAFAVGKEGDLRVFIFSDSLARRKVTESLDPATASPRGQPVAWPSAPVLIVVQNLMAVMMKGSPRFQERVQLALEAGLAGQ